MPATSGSPVRTPSHRNTDRTGAAEPPRDRAATATGTPPPVSAQAPAVPHPSAPATGRHTRPRRLRWLRRWRTRRIGAARRATFARNLATLISGGLPAAKALTLAAAQVPDERAARAARAAARRVHAGAGLADALATRPELCSELQTAIVRAGDTGPFRDRALHDAAGLLQREADLRARADATLTYPAVVVAVVLAIMLTMLLLVVPTFADLYRALDAGLPVATRLLLGAATVTGDAFLPAVALLLAAALAAHQWRRTPAGRLRAGRLLHRIPAVGALLRTAAVARFAYATSALLRAGMPLPVALETVAATIHDPVVAHAAADAALAARTAAATTTTTTGAAAAAALRAHPVIPPAIPEALEAARRTPRIGALDTTLRQLADTYQDEVDAAITTYARRAEPVLLAVMGALVAVIVIALYLPLVGVIDLAG